MTNHANCSHPATKADRAKCRRDASRNTDLAPVALADVKAHALANYDRDGWDVVVEAMSDDEILAVIVGSQTLGSALAKLAAHVAPIEI